MYKYMISRFLWTCIFYRIYNRKNQYFHFCCKENESQASDSFDEIELTIKKYS
jgi:hypothetical protein